jgi:predicted amidophosphoribosyltransferase
MSGYICPKCMRELNSEPLTVVCQVCWRQLDADCKCGKSGRQHLGRGASVPLEATGYYVTDHNFEAAK